MSALPPPNARHLPARGRGWWLFALLSFCLSAVPVLGGARRVLNEAASAPAVPSTASGRLAASNRLHLALSLPLRQPQVLARLLQELYDPVSPNYRRFLTADQFAERFGPTRADYAAVRQFAITNGLTISTEHPNRTLLDVEGTTAAIEKCFQTTLRVYPHPVEKRTYFAPEVAPSIAGTLPLLDVSGLNNYRLPRPKSLHPLAPTDPRHPVPKTGSGPGSTYIGYDFRSAYAPGVTLTGVGQSVGLLEFDGYFASDIAAYEARAGLPAIPLQNVLLDGFSGVPVGTNNNSSEVSLDIELAAAMAPGLASIIVYETGATSLANDILNRMVTDNLAKQISCSWDFASATAGSTDQIFQQMAAQGQAFFDASGDVGAYSGAIPPPNDDPYITIVGGTTLTTGATGAWSAETVWNWYTSGRGSGASSGGMSTSYALPSWQAGISMSANQGSTTKRNLPDVAMTADNVWVAYNNGQTGTFGGTSCAAPLWAGFTALVNQQTMANTGTTVGFLNPALYTIGKGSGYASAFHDITTGNSFPSTYSTKFVAATGFDLCTGWGTPTGQNLINALAGQANPLQVTPAGGITASGPVGGPFSPPSQSFGLTNLGTVPLSWAVVNTNPWLAVSIPAGTLAAAPSGTNIIVTINAAANSLAAGVYAGALQFSNVTAGLTQVLTVNLLVAQNLVLNGGFETGDFTGWTLQGTSAYNHAAGSASSPAHPELVHSGAYGALLGEVSTLGYLSQTLSTVTGQLYLLSFWVNSPYFTGGDSPNEFQVSWNVGGATTILYDQANLAPFNWTNLQFAVPATAPSTVLQFGARNDPQEFGLDDVSVVPIAPPKIRGVALLSGKVTLNWAAVSGLLYQPQYTTNLASGAWRSLGTPQTATNTLMSVVDPQPTDRCRFYRVLLTR